MAAGPKLRVFLDTNVIFSSLYSANGSPAIILELFVKGDIQVVVSQQVLEELVRTIKEKRLTALPALRTLLLNSPPEVVADPTADEVARWTGYLEAGDAAILAATIKAQPDYFVTGDKDFLDNHELAKKAGLKIITVGVLMNLINPQE